MKKLTAILLSTVLSISILTGCSATTEQAENVSEVQQSTSQASQDEVSSQADEQAGETTYPISFDALDLQGNVYPQTYEDVPTKVFPNNQGTAETLLMLGLADNIVATPPATGEIAEGLEAQYNELVYTNESLYIGKEQLISLEPDLAMGRSALFTDDAGWGLGLISDLNDIGINVFTQNASLNDATIDDLFADIRDIGTLFNVADVAEEMASNLETRYSGLTETYADQDELTYLMIPMYQDNQFNVFGSNDTAMHNNGFNGINLNNPVEVTGYLSAEGIIDVNPDVILAVNVAGGGPSDGEIIRDTLMSSAELQSVNAIANDKVIIVDFSDVMLYNFRFLDVLENVAEVAFE